MLSNSINTFYLSKEIIYGPQTRELLLSGVNKLANAVQSTLGPKGSNVILSSKYTEPKITKDGVTVAKFIQLKNPFENMGVKLIQQSSNFTAKKVGDGTTTATVLTRKIFQDGVKAINSGISQIDLRKGINKTLKYINDFLEEISIKVKDKNDIMRVASISANNDKEIGKIIADIFEKVGVDGAINVQNGNKLKHEVSFTKGIQFNNGYISPYFINNNSNNKCEFDNPYILICNDKLENIKDMINLFEYCLKRNKPLLIICDDVDSDILNTLIINKLKGILKVCVVKSPYFGEKKKLYLSDYAKLTGATIYDPELLDSKILENNPQSLLGSAKKAIINSNQTLIIEGNGKKDIIQSHINSLKGLVKNNTNDKEAKERLQKLLGNVAVFKVGGINETEINELKDRIDDSICATRAAIKEGIVPGGGSALLFASRALDKIKFNNYDEEHGKNIIKEALKEPIKIICKNAGINGDIIINQLLSNNCYKYGIDALTGNIVNMLNNGIIDPTLVVKTEIQSAIKVSNMMLGTETAISDIKEEIKKTKL